MIKKMFMFCAALFLGLVILPISVQAAPAITSITPNTACNWGMVEITELAGTGFEEGAMVTLTMEGQPDIEVMSIMESSSIITGVLDATNAAPGNWNVVVTNSDEQSSTLVGGITLTAPPAPTISSNTPDLSDQSGIVRVELTGENFLSGAHVKLTRDGFSDVDAILVMVESSTMIICEFNLTVVDVGHWDIIVINPDGQTGISNSLDVVEASGPDGLILTNDADFYVDDDGNNSNDGLTPETAWKTITHALNTVSGSDITIGVAAGTYNMDLGETFPLPMRNGISLAGAGAEVTIIDAEGANTSVIYCYNIGTGETIEGLKITGGNAIQGGGICCQRSSPTISNCTISGNSASCDGDGCGQIFSKIGGGGIYCSGGYLPSSPSITNCIIANNTATVTETRYWWGGGGGIYCDSYTSPTITNCTISGNTAEVTEGIDEWLFGGGGGVFAESSSFTISGGTISNNQAFGDTGYFVVGGGIYCRGGRGYVAPPTISNCTITGNTNTGSGSSGGGIYCDTSAPTITNCPISYNSASTGGGIYCDRSSPSITNCPITLNTANRGGGIYTSRDYKTTISGCDISNNNAIGNNAGGIGGDGSSPTITNCTINNNTSARSGGGIHFSRSGLTMFNCTIKGNTAVNDGGGLFCTWGANLKLTNCVISGNTADNGGGIHYNDYSTITNCTISGNAATSTGGGIHSDYTAAATVVNTILWGNTASSDPNQIDLDRVAQYFSITYSDIEGENWPGEGNTGDNPMFVDPRPASAEAPTSLGDYHLAAGSPCIDTGNDDALPADNADLDNDGDLTEPIPFDFEGDYRVLAGILDENCQGTAIVDMGADEHDPCEPNGIEGSISASIETLWPPNHNMVPVTIDTTGLTMHNCGGAEFSTSVEISEYSCTESDEVFGENIYDENNFEPDVEIDQNDPLTLYLRSERSGPSMGRTYTITVSATDCSGTYDFPTEVVVPKDKGK